MINTGTCTGFGQDIYTWPNTVVQPYPVPAQPTEDYWKQMFPNTPANYEQTESVSVNITVVETIEGFVGQISMAVAGKNVIVWESAAVSPESYSGTDKKTSEQQAREAAQKSAESHTKTVLRKIFK